MNDEAEVDFGIKHDKVDEGIDVVVKIDADIDDEWQLVSELLGGNGRTLNVDVDGVAVSEVLIGSLSLVFIEDSLVIDNSLKAA